MLNASDTEAFLVTRFGPEVSDVALVGEGAWSRAYAFRRNGTEYIVRFSSQDQDFRKDGIAAGYSSRDLPIPAVVEIGETHGDFFAISERVTGEFLDDLDGGQMRRMLPALFDDRPEERTHGWRERLSASPTGAGPFDEALARLNVLIPDAAQERYLIHSDLLNYNVLVGHRRINAVLDWGCAMYGDFLYDLAWFEFWSPWYAAWRGIDFRQEAARHYAGIGLNVPHFEERLTCCQLHIGLAAQAYNAFKERWDALEETARRTLELVGPGS